jgi:hypothetical protein
MNVKVGRKRIVNTAINPVLTGQTQLLAAPPNSYSLFFFISFLLLLDSTPKDIMVNKVGGGKVNKTGINKIALPRDPSGHVLHVITRQSSQ